MDATAKAAWLKNNPPLLTANDVSRMLGLTLNHIYKMARSKRLPSIKMGRSRRFKATDMLIWLENNAEGEY
jgi:excisionase family DNA binding protein